LTPIRAFCAPSRLAERPLRRFAQKFFRSLNRRERASSALKVREQNGLRHARMRREASAAERSKTRIPSAFLNEADFL
jgi:hypothetical protein